MTVVPETLPLELLDDPRLGLYQSPLEVLTFYDVIIEFEDGSSIPDEPFLHRKAARRRAASLEGGYLQPGVRAIIRERSLRI